MEADAAKLIGAGIACVSLAGAGVGSYLAGALRNPSAAASQQTNLLLGFALCEATGLFGLVVSFILMFGM
jgi:F-type H+-transporting ATPase subunit c